MSKIKYQYGECVILGGVEWLWDDLKQVCYFDFVCEDKARGFLINKYKLPREILNDWIINENWEYDKKSYWQRPYSYRIDGALNDFLKNISKLVQIQNEVDDIDFDKKHLLSRIKIDIEVKHDKQFKKYKTFILEKYSVIIEDFEDEDSVEKTQFNEEIRYKAIEKPGEILIRFLKEKGIVNNKHNSK
jgi:hypothetical protein